MYLRPDLSTFRIFPWAGPTGETVARMICDIYTPDGTPFAGCPRTTLKKVIALAASKGYRMKAGPEAEFFLFQMKNGEPTTESHDSAGYFDLSPVDLGEDVRREIVLALEAMGFHVEAAHHEVAPGQHEIDFRYDDVLTTADNISTFRFVVKNVATRNGLHATFMPKPIYGINGSGMHTHMSLWKGSKPLMAGDGYAGMSELGLFSIGGILKHGRALIALSAPTVNSYHRLVPGFEAPVTLAMSRRNRSAACRIPMYSSNPKAKRVEFRCPDPSACAYLSFTALMMAMLDGIQNKIDPGEPLDRDIYEMTAEELAETNIAPKSLTEALEALEEDHAFLTKGDVFTEDLIETFISWKKDKEIDPIRLRPHPYEFDLYYNC
jgi:glutamine synthetase